MNKLTDGKFSLPEQMNFDGKFLLERKWNAGQIIAHYAKEYGLGKIIHTCETDCGQKGNVSSVTAAINMVDTSRDRLDSLTRYCFENDIPIIYPFDMGWGAAVIISDNNSQIVIHKKTKTGNYNDDIRAYIGRYVSFWSHQTPASLLLNNNPVFSNTLMLQTSLSVLAAIASGKAVRRFPDMYYQLCSPGERI